VIVTVVTVAVVIATAVVVSILSDCRHSGRSDACPGDWPAPGMEQVLVVTRDVQPGESMDALIEDGGIMVLMVPEDALVDGAAMDVSQIEGRTATRSTRAGASS
jgi:hypothetical protein